MQYLRSQENSVLGMAEQGSEWAKFIQEEYKREFDRRSSINARATASITGTTGLVTVLLAVIAVLKGKDHLFTGTPALALLGGLFALLTSALFGIIALSSRGYEACSTETLNLWLTKENWKLNETDARFQVAHYTIRLLKSLIASNDKKRDFLRLAAATQLIAILFLIISAFSLAS